MLLLGSAVLALSSARTPRCAASDLQRAPTSFAAHVLTVLDEKQNVLLDTPELISAAARMEAVTGIPPVALEELWRAETSTCVSDIRLRKDVCDAIMAWAEIERGSDLFVAGKFNIARVHEDLVRKATARSGLPILQDILFRPCDLQTAAYFTTVHQGHPISPASSSGAFRRISRILGHIDGADYPPRQHLLRYRVWWDDPDHINQLDELEDARAAYEKAASDVAERLDKIRVGNILDRGTEFRPPQGYQWADGVDLQRLVVDETGAVCFPPLPSPSIVRIMTSEMGNDDLEAGKLRKQQLLDQANRYCLGTDLRRQGHALSQSLPCLKMGPKTVEALRAHGVETLGELAALTASQQQELLASVPRTIVSQLKRMGGLEAMVDQAKKERDDYLRMDEIIHEFHFKHSVSTARREYAGLLAAEELHAAMWRDDRVALRPEVLLGRLRRLRENAELAKVPDVQYTHLNASLADGPIDSDGLQLRVLRSSRHVWQVGKDRSTSRASAGHSLLVL